MADEHIVSTNFIIFSPSKLLLSSFSRKWERLFIVENISTIYGKQFPISLLIDKFMNRKLIFFMEAIYFDKFNASSYWILFWLKLISSSYNWCNYEMDSTTLDSPTYPSNQF